MIQLNIVREQLTVGEDNRADYHVEVYLPGDGTIWSLVEDFDRGRGWAALVREAVAVLEEKLKEGAPHDE